MLSKVARYLLIRSVSSTFLVYNMQVTKIPIGTIEDIEK